VDWGAFTTAVTVEFGTEEFDTQMAKLSQLRQTGTVMEYRMTFEACMYHLLSLDETLNNKFFVAQFVLGLKDELRTAARLQAPTSVTRAVALARIQEEEMEAHRPRARPVVAHRVQHQAPAALPLQQGPQRQEGPKRAGNDEYSRERQLH
jgi:formate hydrogenlyase subunit 4